MNKLDTSGRNTSFAEGLPKLEGNPVERVRGASRGEPTDNSGVAAADQAVADLHTKVSTLMQGRLELPRHAQRVAHQLLTGAFPCLAEEDTKRIAWGLVAYVSAGRLLSTEQDLPTLKTALIEQLLAKQKLETETGREHARQAHEKSIDMTQVNRAVAEVVGQLRTILGDERLEALPQVADEAKQHTDNVLGEHVAFGKLEAGVRKSIAATLAGAWMHGNPVPTRTQDQLRLTVVRAQYIQE